MFNFDLYIDSVGERSQEIVRIGEKLGELKARLVKCGSDLRVAEQEFDNAVIMEKYREMQKKDSALNGSNAETRKFFAEAFVATLRTGTLRPLVAKMEAAERCKADAEAEIAKFEPLFKAMEIAQRGEVAILECKR